MHGYVRTCCGLLDKGQCQQIDFVAWGRGGAGQVLAPLYSLVWGPVV